MKELVFPYIRYANDKITWELAEKINFGVELGLFNDWNLEVDFFMENRSNILVNRIVGASAGLEADVLGKYCRRLKARG